MSIQQLSPGSGAQNTIYIVVLCESKFLLSYPPASHFYQRISLFHGCFIFRLIIPEMDPNPVTLPTSPRGSPASIPRHENINAKPFLQGKGDDIEKTLKEFNEISKALQAILDNLCQRDTRFDSINAALHELLHGPLGVYDRLGRQLQMIDSALSTTHGINDSDSMIKAKFIPKSKELMKEDPRDHYMLEMAVLEILNTTVFELLDVFRVEITIQQANTPQDPRSYLQLLH
ncbi:hypothetical protein EV127DRAFT_415163 [Xylaria flabelliformis]|nr:hypothetical protein EV127DRAFT_415163 [Xylaria flabelliformis]